MLTWPIETSHVQSGGFDAKSAIWRSCMQLNVLDKSGFGIDNRKDIYRLVIEMRRHFHVTLFMMNDIAIVDGIV